MRTGALLLMLVATIATGQDHYLVINPDGHRSLIYDMDIDAEGNIVTGSFDKTVKVWDSKKGHLIKEFRGQIGPGSEGMVYCIDVSPNNKYLAVGGWMGKNDESERLGDVRIYDYQSGKMVKLLNRVHEDVIMSLKFTNDSKYLITGGADGVIVKWEVSTGIPQLVYFSSNTGMKNIDVADDYFVTTHDDGMFFKWDFDKNKPKKKMNFFEKLDQMNVSSYCDISADGQWIAIAGKELGMVLIFNNKFSLKDYFFTGQNTITDLSFSPDGNRLAVAVKEPTKNRVVVYEKHGKKWNELCSYKGHNSTVLCSKFIDNSTVASAGGFHDEVAVWKIKNEETKEKFVTKGVGETCFSAALNGTDLAFGLEVDAAYGNASYTHVFDLFTRQVREIEDTSLFSCPEQERGDLLLYEFSPLRVMDWDPESILYIIEKSDTLVGMKRYPWDGNFHRSFSFVGENYIVSGGDYGILSAYDYKGRIVSKFVGHEGAVSAVNVSSDGKYLVTSAYDNTMKIWRISEIGRQDDHKEVTSVWKYIEDQYLSDPWHSRIIKVGMEKKAKQKSVEAWNEVILNLQKKGGYNTGFLEDHLNWEKSNTIYPVVSVFVGRNKEWIIWNNDGYFTSSRKGAKYVGYHVNHGKKVEASYYPFDQFDLKYNRPDIIYKDLEMADAGIIELYYQAYLKRLKRMGLTEEDLRSDIHAPVVQLKNYRQSGNKVELNISAKDNLYPLDRLNVYINDVPVFGRKGIKIKDKNIKEFSENVEIDLLDGENKVQVSVLNTTGVESLRETIYLVGNDDTKNDLYIVSLGVSDYKDERYDLEYASKDAKDIVDAFEKNETFNKVNKLLLTNEEVTRENIYTISEFLMAAKSEDIVLMFIAGHGVLDKDLDYYYCTHDIDFINPGVRGVSYSELEALFDGIKALRKLLIMDTCHSGELDKDEVVEVEVINEDDDDLVFRSGTENVYEQKEYYKQTSEAVKEMFNDLNRGTGTTVISSAGGAQFAMESDKWKNGLFTYCLLNGLKSGSADLNNDGSIYISELQEYVRREVVRLSQGKQNPGSRFENISLDYVIW